MSYIKRIQRGVDFIEQNLDLDIDIAHVAQAANMSRWHFQRMFKAITGDTVKSYIRARRFSKSLEALLGTDQSILNIAIDSGFDSQESFTRAFKQHFSMTPGQFRNLGNAKKFMQRARIDHSYLEHINSSVSREPQIETINDRTYLGLKTNFYGSDSEKNNLASKLTDLWSQFLPRMDEIKNAVQNIGYGLIEQSDHNSELLTYYSAMQIKNNSHSINAPSDMFIYKTSREKYAIFEHKGKPLLLDDTVNYIYGTWLPSSDYTLSGSADVEIYGEGYIENSSESVVHYAVPILT